MGVQLPGHRVPMLMVPQDKRLKQRGGAIKPTGGSRGSVGPNPHCAEPRALPDPEASVKGFRSCPNPQIHSKPSALGEDNGRDPPAKLSSNVIPCQLRQESLRAVTLPCRAACGQLPLAPLFDQSLPIVALPSSLQT